MHTKGLINVLIDCLADAKVVREIASCEGCFASKASNTLQELYLQSPSS